MRFKVYCGLKAIQEHRNWHINRTSDRIDGVKKTGCLGFINVAVGVLTGDRINEAFYYSGRNDEVTVRRGFSVYRTWAIDGNLGLP